jgi:glutamate racemase
LSSNQPIGVFDSGLGGLSVLKALHAELPHQRYVYLADSGYAPYGEREPQHVIDRSLAAANWLIEEHGIQALVVACNTATAIAIHLLREKYPALPLVGLEPAIKPAAQVTKTRRVGVLATRGTLESAKFKTLHQGLEGQAEFILQPCDGLAGAIERQDEARIQSLSAHYVQGLGPCGKALGQIDTVVLGCTHYPLIAERLQGLVGDDVTLIESGAPVARQTRRILRHVANSGTAQTLYFTTGDAKALHAAAQRWVEPQPQVEYTAVGA